MEIGTLAELQMQVRLARAAEEVHFADDAEDALH
jgi:hypothetical protein